MNAPVVISLLSDFGYEDSFVGIMKGVILSICHEVRFVDLTHGIAPQDIRRAGLELAAAWPYFPGGSLHLAVVDPGVGSDRRILVMQVGDQRFVAPDNGLLSLALGSRSPDRVVAVRREDLWLEPASRTFHGRDRFAPTVAHLANGVPITEFGEVCEDWQRLALPEPAVHEGEWRGEIIAFDHFGNARTNLSASLIASGVGKGDGDVSFECVGRAFPLRSTYSAVASAAPLALINSQGVVELAQRDGDARSVFGLRVGEEVRVRRSRS